LLVLTFRVGPEPLALDIRRVREVVPRVRLQPVSGGPAWLAGVFVCRGTVVPVIDLHQLAGGGACPPHLSSRIILVPRGDELIGLLATQVADVRDVNTDAEPLSSPALSGSANFGPLVADGTEILRLLDPDRLLPEESLRQLEAVA